jgi:hypothetical protein
MRKHLVSFFPPPFPHARINYLREERSGVFFWARIKLPSMRNNWCFFPGKKQQGTLLDEKRIGVLFWAQNNYPSMRNTSVCFFFFAGQESNHLDEKHWVLFLDKTCLFFYFPSRIKPTLMRNKYLWCYCEWARKSSMSLG